MKFRKKKSLISVCLAFVMVFSVLMCVNSVSIDANAASVSNPVVVADSGNTITDGHGNVIGKTATWDTIWFGSYPQREVIADESSYNAISSDYYDRDHDVIIDAALYKKLSQASGWSNNEITIDGNRYRRMKQSDATGVVSGDGKFYQWSDSTTYHYFKYEPIRWRVLAVNGSKALVLSEEAIDDQVFNTTSYDELTWETCSLRSWLNSSFYNSAFTSSQKSVISVTHLANNPFTDIGDDGDLFGDPIDCGNATNDRIYILDAEQLSDETLGFLGDNPNSDKSRVCTSSTYTKAMGVYSELITERFPSYAGNCYQWTKSPYLTGAKYLHVCRFGFLSHGAAADTTSRGVRPTMTIDLSNTSLWSYAGKVSSDGTDSKIAASCSHTWNEGTVTKAATCSATGSMTYTCTSCGQTRTETIAIDPDNHTWKETVAKAATCTEDGYTAGKVCTACGKTEAGAEAIPAPGHDYVDNKCSRCGAFESLSTPKLISANNTASGIAVKWNASDNAQYYRVYRKTAGGSWKSVAVVNGTSYTDTNVSGGTAYTYTVRCVAAYDQKTLISGYVSAGVSCTRLAEAKTSVSNAVGGVKVSWPKISGAEGYIIYRKTSTGSWGILTKITGAAATSYTDKTAVSGTSYSYTVRAYNGSKQSSYTGVNIKYLKAIVKTDLTITNEAGSVSVKWPKVTGASAYWLYRRTGSGSYKKIAVLTANSYSDTSVVNGDYYTYAVRAVNGSTAGSYEGRTIIRVSGVSLKKVTTPSSKKLKVTWNTNSKSTGYQVQYSTSSSFSSVTTVAIKGQTASKTITKLTSGKKYYVRVRAYKTINGFTSYSAWSSAGSVTVK